MNISKIDGSRYGALLFSQPLPAASSIARARARAVRVPVQALLPVRDGFVVSIAADLRAPSTSRHHHHRHRHYHYHHPTQPPRWRHPGLPLSRPFCSAVATAGSPLPSSYYFTSYPASVRSWNRTAVSTAEPIEESKQPSQPHTFVLPEARVEEQPRDEILNIVDYYDDGISVDDCIKLYRDPYMRNHAAPDGPNITVSDRREDVEVLTPDGDRQFVEEEHGPARDLWLALVAQRRQPAHVSLDSIWNLYQALPVPRPMRISARSRNLLMSALASGERKDEKSMLRYFSVVEDVKNSGFALTSFQWNWALAFASSYVATTTEVEIEAALKLWRSMESEAKIKGNDVTFNILFDCASKAGKFNLAEMIYREMAHRRYPFNRFHHVSLIHFFGLKMDSSGVRAAYREMVEAGEMIDTVVCNCLISSFIRCGEEQSAEYVYEKMKASIKKPGALPHRDYTMAKAVTKVLQMFTRVGRRYPSLRYTFQSSALLSPDLHTFRILVNHYGVRLGRLSKVVQFLDEMQLCMVPLNGVIFLALFKSFAIHGGSGSDWSAQRLSSVWKAFLNAIDARASGLHISSWMAMAALEAHARYATRDEMLQVFDCLRSRWNLDDPSSQYMVHFLQSLLRQAGLETHRPRWLTMVE